MKIIASKRRSLHNTSSNLDFKPKPNTKKQACEAIPEPTKVQPETEDLIVQVCRKTLFIDASVKIGIYGTFLFVVSLLGNKLPFPKTYFSKSDNLLNQYFVKVSWSWTLFITSPFLIMTSYTYCCGKHDKILKHLSRLGIATFAWFFWTKLFRYIEYVYGRCNVLAKRFETKEACIAGGFFWYGFDISGHAFILIYSSLVLMEEARAINGWEGIRDLIQNEEHARSIRDVSVSNNPLRGLSLEEFLRLKKSYDKFTPYIRLLFIGMTFQSVLCDVMLMNTIIYFHSMLEKFIGGYFAVFTWFFTYRYWYTCPGISPNLPGEGLFKYKDLRHQNQLFQC